MKLLKILLGFLVFSSMNQTYGLEKGFAEIKEAAKILGFAIGSSSAYGIINNQVIIRICKEFFTEGFNKKQIVDAPDDFIKKTLLSTKSSTKIAAIWGVMASWWMGAMLGIPVVGSARVGSWPKLTLKEFIKPVGAGFTVLGLISFLAGLKKYLNIKDKLDSELREGNKDYTHGIQDSKLKKWWAIENAQGANYLFGTILGFAIVIYNLIKRYNLNKLQSA